MIETQAELPRLLPATRRLPAAGQLPEALPTDYAARASALDITRSYIVQAPAGSGKTELLTQRFLTLLAHVDEPEEILAITFTRAATAEMRTRILTALEQAAALRGTTATPGEPQTLTAARAALAHAEARGWQLLEQPHRLDIQTIDSLCLRLAHGQPLLARLGGQLEPSEQSAAFYQLAAQRTLARLGSGPVELDAALRHLLLLRDNNLGNCRRLLAGMLACREQWSRLLILAAADAEVHAEADHASAARARAELEAPFAQEVQRVLGELHAILAAEPALVAELLELARYSCANASRASTALLDGLQSLPAPEAHFISHWTCLHHFLLTSGNWRKGKGLTKTHGFPSDGTPAEKKLMRAYKDRMESLLLKLAALPQGTRLRALLAGVPTLPAARYTDEQWQTLLSVFRVLRYAVAELHVVFAERNQVDFAELSIAAATVLEDTESTRGLLASETRRHLLIDEFQDTSRRQHRLIGRLLREWQPGDGRTCFLVGDPMQSIYIFRQAEVELFGRVQRQGLDCGTHAHPCAELTLSENFRSHAGLVEPLNRFFTEIFTAEAEAAHTGAPDVAFTASTPAAPGEHAVAVHTFFSDTRDPDGKQATRAAEVARVVQLVEQEQPNLAAAAARGASYTVAILGRAKNHLTAIAAALRERGLAFRAVELETLGERQEILDLQSLLRALLHPADRIAWLSVLRAPWCGLTLGDLHLLTGADDPAFRYTPVPALIAERAHLLSADGRKRLLRAGEVLQKASAARFQHRAAPSLSAWLERAWTSLGAPAYLTPNERENAEVFFSLLDDLAPGGVDVLSGAIDAALAKLCAAPDATVSERCGVQLMTIHKAKGLGFEVVIVPALERATGNNGSPLVTMLERANRAADAGEEADQLLVAPLSAQGSKDSTYSWVQAERARREAGERKRLFYVACTRARQRLHLLGTATVNAQGEVRGGRTGSLLDCAWPALRSFFESQRGAFESQHAAGGGPLDQHTQPGPVLVTQHAEPGIVESLAAEAHASPDQPTAPARVEDTLWLLRVPSGFRPRIAGQSVTTSVTYVEDIANQIQQDRARLVRPQGSFEQRARGTAIHALLELVAELWAESSTADAAALDKLLARLAQGVLREQGLAPARVAALNASLVPLVLRAIGHPHGRWLLAPHPEARSEWSLSTRDAASPQTEQVNLRIDRCFRAGSTPGSTGTDYLWIIDYKTGAEPGKVALDAYLEGQKEQWRPQLERYGEALRTLYGAAPPPLRYALYFPELLQLKAWGE